MKVFRFAMINAGAKMNPQFWGERWNILCRSWPASPFGSCTPHLHFAVGSWKKIGIERTLVLSVEYVNLCNDVFYTFVACSVTTLRRVLYSLPKLETPQETEPDLPASVGASPEEALVGRGPWRGHSHWKQQCWEIRFGKSAWMSHRACSLQDWIASGQRTNKESHPSADNWTKDLLSTALPTRTRPSFPYSQSLPSGSLQKPLILIHQKADRRSKNTILQPPEGITQSQNANQNIICRLFNGAILIGLKWY